MRTATLLATCVLGWVLAAESVAADRVFLLSNFRPGGPDFVQGDGTVVAPRGADAPGGCRLDSDEKGYRGIEISDAAALARFRDHRWLKADVFVPGDAGVSYSVRFDDARSRDYNSRTNLDGRYLPTGRSTMVVDLKFLRRSGNLERPLDLDTLRIVKIFLGPSKDRNTIFFNNVRLEGSPDDPTVETVLFDFENDDDLARWSPLASDDPKVRGGREPPVKLELSAEGATSGKRALKLTCAGGTLPTVTTARIPIDDWRHFPTIKADITVSRDCVVLLRVLREKSDRSGRGRWEKLCRLFPGRNTVVELTNPAQSRFDALGKVVAFDIAMYEPREGESLCIDNVRLVDSYPEATTACRYMNPTVAGGQAFFYPFFPKPDAFRVLGTDWELYDMDALTAKLRPSWTKPEPTTLEQVEAAFRTRYEELKRTHPRAVMVTLREGDTGCDPPLVPKDPRGPEGADPARTFTGWSDNYVGGHDPAPAYIAAELGRRRTADPKIEMFLRRRAALLRVDLSSIPKGAEILAARLVLVKADKPQTEGPYSVLKPAFLYCEPCRRPWVETEMNAVEYAKGRFWKEIGGMDWSGDDPDFAPLIVACGQAGYNIDTLDFTLALKYWLAELHENHGWVMCSPGTAMEYTHIWSREAPNVKDRPALMVVYETK